MGAEKGCVAPKSSREAKKLTSWSAYVGLESEFRASKQAGRERIIRGRSAVVFALQEGHTGEQIGLASQLVLTSSDYLVISVNQIFTTRLH